MLVSTLNLSNAIKNYEINRENFYGDSSSRDVCLSCIIIALILFVVEVAVLYFALTIAWSISDTNTEKFLHVVLALTLTLPYLLLNLLFNQRAKAALL
jgi:phosphotransferase system  glucose/maltose/N-acetylglucosamine-specific IIC component